MDPVRLNSMMPPAMPGMPGPSIQEAASPREAAEEFVSYLFAQVFKEMRPQEEEGGLFGGENPQMFMDFFDMQLGRHYASNGGHALVDQLLEQSGADRKLQKAPE